jgi:ABC-type Na+ transport system ATPase subunit NatA
VSPRNTTEDPQTKERRELQMITQNSTRTEAVGTETALAVHATGVHKSFSDSTGSKFRAVRELNLSIPRGQVVAFLGPNGAGKSTTIDMILGLTEPDGGTIEVLGTDPLTAASTGRSAAVLQSGGLLPDVTVGALVAMMGSLYIDSDPAAAITRAGLGGLVNRRVSKCSGGEQQKVRFALALLSNPELLLLDEPTAGMDVTARKHFWQAMRAQAANGTTVMFATHYLEEAQDLPIESSSSSTARSSPTAQWPRSRPSSPIGPSTPTCHAPRPNSLQGRPARDCRNSPTAGSASCAPIPTPWCAH